MLVTISRLDKLAAAYEVFSQLGMMEGTTASYTAMILHGELPQPKVSEGGDDNGEDDDIGLSPGPKSLSSIELARTPGLFPFSTSLKEYLYISSQNEGIQGGLRILQLISISHDFHNSSTASSMNSLTQIQMSCLLMSISTIVPILGDQSVFIILLLPVSTHPAIFVVLAGCTENGFAQTQTGMGSTLDMILCLCKLMLSSMECQVW
jgi:hypothetical protein